MVSEHYRRLTYSSLASLNPCCCGRWSQRAMAALQILVPQGVLILVLVEDGFRDIAFDLIVVDDES